MYAHISILILIIIFFLPIVHRPYRVLIYPAPKTFLEKSSIFLRYENVKKKKKRKKEKKDLYIWNGSYNFFSLHRPKLYCSIVVGFKKTGIKTNVFSFWASNNSIIYLECIIDKLLYITDATFDSCELLASYPVYT